MQGSLVHSGSTGRSAAEEPGPPAEHPHEVQETPPPPPSPRPRCQPPPPRHAGRRPGRSPPRRTAGGPPPPCHPAGQRPQAAAGGGRCDDRTVMLPPPPAPLTPTLLPWKSFLSYLHKLQRIGRGFEETEHAQKPQGMMMMMDVWDEPIGRWRRPPDHADPWWFCLPIWFSLRNRFRLVLRAPRLYIKRR